MAAASQLEQISKLIERLKPLLDKKRGMRIEPDEWNALVGAMIDALEIDRIQEQGGPAALEERFARRDHTHVGQTSLDWLDADLQSRVATGGGGSIGSRTALTDTRRVVDDITTETARLTAVTEEQQRRLDRASAGELQRVAQLREFADRFESVEGLRPTITELGAHVGTVNERLDEVLDFRSQLIDPAGEPVDVVALAGEQAELRRLAENFNGVDGNPVRMRDIELRIAELETTVDPDSSGRLDARIAAAVAGSEERLQARQDEHDSALVSQVSETLSAARAELQGLVDGRLADADARIARVLDEVQERLPELVREAIGGALQELEERMKQQLEELRAEVERTLREMSERNEARFRRIEERLDLPPIERVDPRFPDIGGIVIRNPGG